MRSSVRERTPALRILRPGVAGKDHPAAGLPAVIRIVQVPNGQVGDRASAEDAIILLPEAAPALEEDLGRGIIVQLPDGALLGAREGLQDLDMPQHRERHGDDGIVTRLLWSGRRPSGSDMVTSSGDWSMAIILAPKRMFCR